MMLCRRNKLWQNQKSLNTSFLVHHAGESALWTKLVGGYGKTILFIDRKYAKNDGGDWDKGQPTYSYGVDTIAAHKHNVPLCLDLGQDWFVDADAMNVAIDVAKSYL